MHNKYSKNGSERFWPTPVAQPSQRETTGGKNISHTDGTKYGTSIAQAVRDPNYTTTSSPSTAPTMPASICSQGDFLANLSASPGSDSARKMTVRSGLRCSELLTAQTPVGSLVRTLLESSRWNSTISYLTWKASATPRGRLLFRLVPSMPDIEETGFGLWPTPTSRDHKDAGKNLLDSQIRQNGHDRKDKLGYAAKMWPTPGAEDVRDRGNLSMPCIQRRKEMGKQLNLSMVADPHSGSLNPNWVEWLMGYPIGHTACEGWATPSSRRLLKKSSSPSEPSNNPNPSNQPR